MFWYGGNSTLTVDEMQNNAENVYLILTKKGYSQETICAILGNMQAESNINPNRYEIGGGGGYGLVQWTPQSKLENHAKTLGYTDYTEGEVQLEVLDAEIRNKPDVASWYTTEAFINNYVTSGATSQMIDVTGTEFITNSNSFTLDELTILFMVAYERPSYEPEVNHIESRKKFSNEWYKYFEGRPAKTDTFPWWLYLRKF